MAEINTKQIVKEWKEELITESGEKACWLL